MKPYKCPRIVDKSKGYPTKSPEKVQKHKPMKPPSDPQIKNKTEDRNGWSCSTCFTINEPENVFCKECGITPPSEPSASKPVTCNIAKQIRIVQNPVPSTPKTKAKFKAPKIAPPESDNPDPSSLPNLTNHKNRKKNGEYQSEENHEYPDHQIHYKFGADPKAKKYGQYLERNIRREQSFHINEFNEYFKKLHPPDDTTDVCSSKATNTIISDAFRWRVYSYERDLESDETLLSFTKVKSQLINAGPYKYSEGELSAGTGVLALCSCQLEDVCDINKFYRVCISS